MAGDSAAKEDVGAISEKYNWGNPNTLQRHFEEHASDFGFTSAEDYANQANQFFRSAQENGLQIKVESDGYMRIYDSQTNTFGSYNPDGTTRTFFKPPGGQPYFNEQPGILQTQSLSSNIPTENQSPTAENLSSPFFAHSEPLVEEPIIIEEPLIVP